MKILFSSRNSIKGIALPINWIFAIIVGGFIVFLSIYGATKLVSVGEKTINTELASRLESLFDPLGAGISSGKSSTIKFNSESRLEFDCQENVNQPFGKETVVFSEKTFGNSYGEKSDEIPTTNYIFSSETIQGESLTVFSQPVTFGFFVGDAIQLYTEEYCFVKADDEIKENLKNLQLPKITFVDSIKECNGITVCFNQENCIINVQESGHYVINKNYQGKRMYYIDNLLYSAIFSSPDIYECNIKRLKQRYDSLVRIYNEKSKEIEKIDCFSDVSNTILSTTGPFNNSFQLLPFQNQIKMIISQNKGQSVGCRLF